MQKWVISSSLLLLFACGEKQANIEIETSSLQIGGWRMEMDLGGDNVLPFEFDLEGKNDSLKMTIFNDKEVIEVTELFWKEDSLFAQLPIFESEFILVKKSKTLLEGVWVNYYKGADYQIPVKATYGKTARFTSASDDFMEHVSGKYEVHFSPNTADESNAIGLFKQEGNKLTGTFATETGDYRHLAGNVVENKIFLSTFDGSHAFLFKAEQTGSGLVGTFLSGTHWKEIFTAVKNDEVVLRNPNELTFIKEGYEGLAFELPDAEGKLVSLKDERFNNKPVIVQIMGSWCPNCLDETKYLTSLYNKYNYQGLEIVALAFERTSSKEKALINLSRLKKKTGASYTFLLGGATRNDIAAEKLPMLNHIMSYPTAIFIDKKGAVRRIHTGFYGPSTGKYYADFVTETEDLVEKMISEK